MSETQSSYPFASARVKALEPRLITKEKLSRLIEAKDYETAIRQLNELGYGQSAPDFEAMIQKELEETDALLLALSPSDVFTRIVRADRDYYNLKVIIKLLMRDQSIDSVVLAPGNLSVETLRRAISENNYFELSPNMTDALNYIDKQFTVVTDPSIIGVALDRAYAKEVRDLVAEMNDELVTQYYTVYFDLSNIIALLRVRAADAPKETFERAFLKGGRIDKRTLLDAFDVSDDSFLSAAAKGDYASILADAFEDYQKTASLYMLEKSRDDYLLLLLEKHRHDMFGIGPLMGYYVAKQREAAAIRMVMTAKQGGIDADVVTKRLKELY
jgi:V/A-type H+-transporting ATPase subunit C